VGKSTINLINGGVKSKKTTVNGIFSRGFLLSSIVTGQQSNPQNPQIHMSQLPQNPLMFLGFLGSVQPKHQYSSKGGRRLGFCFPALTNKCAEFTQTMEDVEVAKAIGVTRNHPVVIGP